VTVQVIGVLRGIYGDRFVAELVTLPPGTQKPVSRRSRSLLAVPDEDDVSDKMPFIIHLSLL